MAPDGSRIAFLNQGHTEIWMMGSEGQERRRIARAGPGFEFTRLEWSPNGQRLAYMKYGGGGNEAAIESLDLRDGAPETLLSDQRLRDFCWLHDGTVLFARLESPNQMAANFWEIAADAQTGRPAGSPKRITSWSGFSLSYLSTSADGKAVAFIRSQPQSDVYVGDLEANGTRLESVRRLTLDDRIDWPGGWDRESKAVLFFSDRNGGLDLFRQDIQQRTAETILAGPEEERGPQLSSDGAWILYWAWPETQGAVRPQSGRLMRLPISGGASETVLEVRGYPGSAQVVPPPDPVHLTPQGFPDFRCGTRSGASCVLAEADGGQLVFSAFDPAHGRGRQLFRANANPLHAFWDLGPEGDRIALFGKEDDRTVSIFTTDGHVSAQVPVSGSSDVTSVAWDAGGKGLFVTDWSTRGASLLHVTLNGETQVLRKAGLYVERPVPSPDGRRLAFGAISGHSNAWMITNFH